MDFKSLPVGIKVLAGVAVVAILAVVIYQQRESARTEAWEALAAAARSGNSVESLETAAQATKDSAAEPWAALLLARALYDEGHKESFERARLVAQEALDRHPDHPAATQLSRVLAAVESLARLGPS